MITKALAENGAKVYIVGRRMEMLEKRKECYDGKEDSCSIDVECLIKMRGISRPQRLVDLGEGGIWREWDCWSCDTWIRDKDVDEAFFFGDMVYDFAEVGFTGHVTLERNDVSVLLTCLVVVPEGRSN